MAKLAKQNRLANPNPKVIGNGNGHSKTSRRAPRKAKSKNIVYFASVFPTKKTGRPVPDEFVKLVRKLESTLKMPVWFLITNGDSDYCCESICVHAFRGFQKSVELIKYNQPVALLIESPGGDAHHAYSIARFFQRRTQKFTVLVPKYAKSAATLLALGASELILGLDSELGPLDVQMADREREDVGSALDAVQSLERLNVFSLTAIDQLMLLLATRTGKKLDTILPLVLNYSANFVRPLLEKIDTVDYTKKSRELKVAEEYAVRLMQKNYPLKIAKQIAAHLVEKYPTHGFVIDRTEAQSNTIPGETYGLGLNIRPASQEIEKIFTEMRPFLDSISVIGKLEPTEL